MSLDKSTACGIVLALAGIGVGLVLDGGKLAQVLQPTAALIVIGGTVGAVMVQFPLKIVLQALGQLRFVFFSSEPESDSLVKNLMSYAYKARKEGILSLDAELAKKINSAVFPGLQGGPLMHVIAAKAVAFGEALRPEFRTYQEAVVENAKVLADTKTATEWVYSAVKQITQ